MRLNIRGFRQFWVFSWNLHILIYKAFSPKYEYFLMIFHVSGSNTTPSMIFHSFRRIESHLSNFWPFYGQKLPRKFSFSLYNLQFNSSNSLNGHAFVPNLIFIYSIGTTKRDHGQIKILKKILLVQNRIFLSPTPKFEFSLK